MSDDKQIIQQFWETNFLNIKKATLNASDKRKKIIVAFETYDFTVNRNQTLYPWAREALQLISNNDFYSLHIWSIYNDEVSKSVNEKFLIPNGIKIDSMNGGILTSDPNYSSKKPMVDVLLDGCSGFNENQWYWVYQLFRISDSLLHNKDITTTSNIIRGGTAKFTVKPTTVRIINPIKKG